LRESLIGIVDDAERGRREAALGRALGASLQAPQDGDAPAIWAAAISHGADKSVALGWLGRVQGDAILAQIACDGRFAEVRLAAAQRIDDSAALDAVARASKNRDKGVYRHCADLLRARRENQERTAHAAQIAQTLRKLLDHAPVSVSHLLEAERGWKALAGAAAQAESDAIAPSVAGLPEVFQECRDLLAQANARILDEGQAQRALHAVAAGHDALAAEVGVAGWPDAALLDAWRQRRDTLSTTLAALPGWLTGSGTAHAVGAGLASLQAQLDGWSRDRERLGLLEQFLAGIVAGASPDAQTVAAWEALPKPEHAPTRQQLNDRWEALVLPAAAEVAVLPDAAEEPAAPPPIEPAPPMSSADLDTLRAQLEQLEQALEAGQLGQADAAARLVKATQGSHGLEGRVDARLQRAMLRLGELRGWAQWGATKKREDLIDAAQQLRSGVAAGTHNVEHLAVAIPALREEWKRLNAQGTAAKGQWESFDRALEAAYVPVAAFHAEESERRRQARAAREALLAQWETALAAIDWQQPDPAAIDALREGMLVQWRAAPHAGFRDERLLRTRFDTLVQALDERLEAARAAEIERREALIAAVTSLADAADPRQAITQAKALQERWRSEAGPMRLRRGEEQKLWQRFRTGCDAVFARRDAERAAQTAQRQERAQARAALLEAFSALLDTLDPAAGDGAAASGDGSPDQQVTALKRGIAQFRSDWESGAGEITDTPAGQDRQARELLQRGQQCVTRLQEAALEARYATLAQSAPSPDGVDPALLEKGRAEREEILIDLEIALGLATPGAAAQIRRNRQLEQLQNRFRSGAAPAPRSQDPEKLLAQWHAIVAAPDATHVERLAAAVQAVIGRQRALLARSEPEPARRELGSGRPRANPALRTDPRMGARAEPRTRR
jgi:hypothetical protein